MPAEGLAWLPKPALLTFEEIDRLAGIFLSLGVRTMRLTGGEPLMRRDLPTLISLLSKRGVPDLSMTTNGMLLDEHADALAGAGLKRINVSVDSLLAHRFAELTRRDALDRVMAGLRAAEAAGLAPLKLNCVVIRGTNDDEVVDFARLARESGYEVRFIEFMPLDADQTWTLDKVVPSDEIIASIGAVFPLERIEHGPEPATVWRFSDGAPGSVGVIPSVTAPFCGSCNRIRITADGQLRNCLFALQETDLRALLRDGATDAQIADAIRENVRGKWAGHHINKSDFTRPARSMSMIGG